MFDVLLIILIPLFVWFSYLDIRYREINAFILTATILVVLLLRPENLIFGIAGYLFGLTLRDFVSARGFEFGIADVKLLTVIGFLIPTANSFMIFLFVFSIFQLFYTLLMDWKFGYLEDRPFIPLILAVYLALLFGGILV